MSGLFSVRAAKCSILRKLRQEKGSAQQKKRERQNESLGKIVYK